MNAIEVCDVSKVYPLYAKPKDRLLEALMPKRGSRHTDHRALDHVSFSVEKGTTVGIIGTNGSGKSTILKIITGVVTPTDGTVTVDGTVSALLELGAGFNMEYTGMENLYMNGTMMGYTKEQMEEKIPAILEFADIGEYVNQPVKTYSSGMFVRLAFALAINVEPDILIVDEALSVGDVFFQAKCYRRMEEIRNNGTTIVMVTHDMSSIIRYCDKVVVLNKGHFVAAGEPGKMVDIYKKILVGIDPSAGEAVSELIDNKAGTSLNPQELAYGNGTAEILEVEILDDRGQATNMILKGSEYTVRMKVKFARAVENPIFAYKIKDKKGTELCGTNTMYEDIPVAPAREGEVYTITFTQRMTLQGGEYLISMGCTSFENGVFVVYARRYDVAAITVVSSRNTVGVFDPESKITVTDEKTSE